MRVRFRIKWSIYKYETGYAAIRVRVMKITNKGSVYGTLQPNGSNIMKYISKRTNECTNGTKARFIATIKIEKACLIRGWEGYGFDSTKGYPGEGPTSDMMGLLDEPESFQVGHKRILETLIRQTTNSHLWSGDDLTIREDHTGMRIATFNTNGKMANQLEEITIIHHAYTRH